MTTIPALPFTAAPALGADRETLTAVLRWLSRDHGTVHTLHSVATATVEVYTPDDRNRAQVADQIAAGTAHVLGFAHLGTDCPVCRESSAAFTSGLAAGRRAAIDSVASGS